MDRNRWRVGFLGCIMVLGLLFTGGCEKTVAVNSRWASEEIVVDGQDSDWRAGGLYYNKKMNLKIGIRNDAQNLYFCLICKDEVLQRQILQGGLTLWVCQDKKKNKLWGLRYPVGGERTGGFGGPQGTGGGGAPGGPGEIPAGDMDGGRNQSEPNTIPPMGSGGPARNEPGSESDRLFTFLNDFELLSSEDEPGETVRSEELAAFGLEGKYSQQQEGGFIYEVKIPLNKTEKTPYAVVPSKKGCYLIGFLSEKIDSRGLGGGMGGGMSGGMGGMNFIDTGGGIGSGVGGGMGGGRGGGGGGGEMGRGGAGGSAGASSIELWAMIQLATGPASCF